MTESYLTEAQKASCYNYELNNAHIFLKIAKICFATHEKKLMNNCCKDLNKGLENEKNLFQPKNKSLTGETLVFAMQSCFWAVLVKCLTKWFFNLVCCIHSSNTTWLASKSCKENSNRLGIRDVMVKHKYFLNEIFSPGLVHLGGPSF